MTSGLVLLLVGGLLLGGAWSVWRTDEDNPDRGGPQVALAVVLFIAAALATVAGILRLV
jgi:uncharacterized membrane protein YidH (DUF202 family)